MMLVQFSEGAGSAVHDALALPPHWARRLSSLHFAYQPLVATDTMQPVGVEALLRGVSALGVPSIHALFDQAYAEGVLHAFDLALRSHVIAAAGPALKASGARLFYNLDTRCVLDVNYAPGCTAELLTAAGLEPGQVCLEISEQHEVVPRAHVERLLCAYREQGYALALDDYGVGFGQMRTLFLTDPQVLKVDRFFVTGADVDVKRQFFLSRLCDFAHALGIEVVAEGVETAAELAICRELGFDIVQGYALRRPQDDIHAALSALDAIPEARRMGTTRLSGTDD